MGIEVWKTVGIFVSVGFLILGILGGIFGGFAVFISGGDSTGFIVACAVSVISAVALAVFLQD